MYYKLDWHITIGEYQLGFLDNVTIHESVDLLADTCEIMLPATIENKAIKVNHVDEIEGKIKRGDVVKVWLGYDQKNIEATDVPEFEGYIERISTDDGSIILHCEDNMFLMRKVVADKQFKSTDTKTIVQYLLSSVYPTMKINCSLNVVYNKFIISRATAFDVLKKIQEETRANIYIKKQGADLVLNIHPPYIENHGYAQYSFQANIEKSDLEYKSSRDRRIEIEVENTGKDGKTIKVTSGTTGGDRVTIKGYGLSSAGMKVLADAEYRRRVYDGYEGSITGWLIPFVKPGYSAYIHDEDYDFKNGWYYVVSVTTSADGRRGGVRKIQLGIKTAGNG